MWLGRPAALVAVVVCSTAAVTPPPTSFAAAKDRAPLQRVGARRPAVPFVVSRVPVDDPVVFVTIDDGFFRTDAARAQIDRLGWPVTSFVLPGPLSRSVGWFRSFGPAVTFGNHSVNHPSLPKLDEAAQRREICGAAERIEKLTGTAPVWLRPPYGSYDRSTLRAAKACGMHHVVLWRVVVSGRRVTTWGRAPIRAGDVILLHYRKDLDVSLAALERKLRVAGLTPAPLADYLD